MAATDATKRARGASAKSAGGTAHAGDPSAEMTALGLAFRHLFRAVSRMRGRDTHLAGGESAMPSSSC